jgi:3-deoxy-manno-octulosonate cytidylyltransferase (CMP-KDO synthetase)
MTSADHPSGTDRVAEVVKQLPCDAAINVQGDEPLINPAVVDAVAKALSNAPISTAATVLTDPAEFDNPNVVKVVVNLADRALYFSRRTIPYLREAANRPAGEQLAAFVFLKHIGIYGYRADALIKLVALPVSPLEKAEQLEQLRALDNGIEIAVVRVDYEGVAVDVPGDVRRVEERLAGLGRTLIGPK